jgi:prephenate dehydratase
MLKHKYKMDKLRIGIQGVAAAFHDMAARNYFIDRDLELVEFRDFRTLSECTANKEVDYSIMAIENTIGGSILPNYGFIEEYGLQILGEEYLRITMQLMAIPGQNLSDIREVVSHPMALRQCMKFLSGYPTWKITEASDTAESAKIIAEEQLFGKAAIASSLAASTYGLEILATDIETNKQNYTRFLVVGAENENHVHESNKASVRLILTHEPGSLSRALIVLDKYGLNLTKIQSVPIIGKPYEYAIHFDIEFDQHEIYKTAMAEIKQLCYEVNVMGVYKKGTSPVVV